MGAIMNTSGLLADLEYINHCLYYQKRYLRHGKRLIELSKLEEAVNNIRTFLQQQDDSFQEVVI